MDHTISTDAPSTIDGKTFAVFAALCIVIFFVISVANPLSNSSLTENEYLVIENALALPVVGNSNQLPDESAQWEGIEFPLHWRNLFTDVTTVWYKAEVSTTDLYSLETLSSESGSPEFGVYIWRLNQTADIWFNGEKIGSGSPSSDRMPRQWNRPLYFPIPPSLIQENNTLLIKHFAEHGWGSMEPVVVGEGDILEPIYNFRLLIQHDLALGLFVFVISSGIFTFTVWFYRRQESQYFWFALASIGLSFYCLNQFVQYTIVSANTWRWLVNMSTDFWAVCLLIFMFRSLQIERPTIEKILLGYVLCGIPIYFYASFFKAFEINVYFHSGSLLAAVYSFYACLNHYLQTKSNRSAFYCMVIIPVFIAGLHDTVMQAILNIGIGGLRAPDFQNHFNFLHFIAPLLFLFIAASLVRKFIDSMNEADMLNLELEERIEGARQELADNYKAIEEVLVYQSASEERERIYRDLHDDVGSKLLSLYYRLDDKSDSTLAKSALEDLRDIVSRKTLESIILVTAVQQWHNEALDRVSDADIPLVWNFESDDNQIVLDELQHTHLRRMLREVLSNAILHGESVSEIRVAINAKEGQLALEVSNDGAAKPIENWSSGRGLSNLKIRTRDLQGEFEIKDLEGSWVAVYWQIPLTLSKGKS